MADKLREGIDKIVENTKGDNKYKWEKGRMLVPLKSGKKVYVETNYGDDYQVATEDMFGDYNPWQRAITEDEVINGEKYNFVKGHEIMKFKTPEEAIAFIRKQYGD